MVLLINIDDEQFQVVDNHTYNVDEYKEFVIRWHLVKGKTRGYISKVLGISVRTLDRFIIKHGLIKRDTNTTTSTPRSRDSKS